MFLKRAAMFWSLAAFMVEQMYEHMDADGSGKLDFRELLLGFSTMLSGSVDDKIAFYFSLYDQDGSVGPLFRTRITTYYAHRVETGPYFVPGSPHVVARCRRGPSSTRSCCAC